MVSAKTNAAWIVQQQGKHFCHCGCGELIQIKIHHKAKGIPRFLLNHHILGQQKRQAKGVIPKHLPKLYKCGHPRTVKNSYFGPNNLHRCRTCTNKKSMERAEWRKSARGRLVRRGWAKQYTQRIRKQFIEAYGGKCSCCGETEIRFLTMEHINNGGNDERRRYSKLNSTGPGVAAIITRLRREGWPQGRYTVLCWNCNMARAYAGICPHKQK